MFYPLILAVLVCLYGVYYIPEVKGWIGEWIVRVILSALPSGKYRVLNNIYIPAYDGMFTQIDHIVVSGVGIIVIETKNYSGKIKGSSRKKYWETTTEGGKGKVYNPIRQNSYHIRMLKDNCPRIADENIFSVICMFNRNNVEVETSIPMTGPVGLVRMIKKLTADADDNQNKCRNIESCIREICVNSGQASYEHRRKLTSRIRKIKSGYCPRCNSKLTKKRGVKGEYLICTNYPACSFRVSNKYKEIKAKP